MGYLSDITRRRLAALLLVGGGVVGAAAAANVGPFSDPATPEERAQQAVVDFFDAANAKDYQAMCHLLTPTTQTQMIQRTTSLLAGQATVSTCPDALKAQVKALSGPAAKALTGTQVAKVDDSRVSGNRAAVDVELQLPGEKRREPRTFELELDHGRWKISGSVL